MGRAQRFGIRLSRGWTVLLLLAAVLVAAAYWIGPLRSFPAEFELAIVDEGTLKQEVALDGVRTPEGAVQFALPLAARNIGAEEGAPRRVAFSVPAQYRVFTRRGMLPVELSQGVALRRYLVNLRTEAVPPDSTAFRLPGLDTIWLEADLPRYYCTITGVQVPEFIPAPKYDAATLGNLRIFYSVTEAPSNTRNTGVLSIQLPPALLESTPAPMPPTFPTIVEEPEAQVPEFGTLFPAGMRRAQCGDPQNALELYTVLWETRQGGRVYVIFVDAVQRKRLYDLNRDGIVELETWDGDGDGRFETRRAANYAVPEFLNPLPPRDPGLLRPDSLPPDSSFLAVFRNTAAGPARFATFAREDSIRAVTDSLRAVADSMRAAADTLVRPTLPDDTVTVPPPDPEWLALFNNTAAGPFRFTRRAEPVQPPRTDTARPALPRPDTARPAAPAADTTPAPRDTTPPPPPRRRAPQPIGTPVPYPPPS